MGSNKRVALYLRVSTDGQTTDNQRLELEQVAAHRGWQIVATYADHGISGAKGRDKRPQFDALLKDNAIGSSHVCHVRRLCRVRAIDDQRAHYRRLGTG